MAYRKQFDENLAKKMIAEGKKLEDVAKVVGVSTFTLSSRLNLPKRRKDIPIDELLKMKAEGKTQGEMAEHFQVSTATIAKRLKISTVNHKQVNRGKQEGFKWEDTEAEKQIAEERREFAIKAQEWRERANRFRILAEKFEDRAQELEALTA